MLETKERLFRGKYYDEQLLRKAKREGFTPYIISDEFEFIPMYDYLKEKNKNIRFFMEGHDGYIYFLTEADLKKISPLSKNLAEMKKTQDKYINLLKQILHGIVQGRITGEDVGLSKKGQEFLMSDRPFGSSKKNENIKKFDQFNNGKIQ